MSVVLCLPAHLCVSTAASRGRPPTRTRHYRVAVPPEGRGAPPGPGGAEGRACGSPAEVGAGGGGGGAAPPPALGPVWEGGGGGEWGGRFGPLVMPPVGRGGGGGMAVLAPGASHRPGGRALPPPPSTESRILAQALAGAPHPPAVVARRRPAGGGREG